MVRLSTHSRLLVLTALIGCTFLVGFFLLFRSGNRQSERLLQDLGSERTSLLENLVKLYGQPVQNLAFDYSYWDEMVDFVKSKDTVWADDNILTSLSTYESDVAWVFGTDWTEYYGTAAEGRAGILQERKLLPQIRAAFSKDKFSHFFVTMNSGLLELRTAPIQPSADNERVTPPQGIFVVGKLWDRNQLTKFEDALHATITLVVPGAESDSRQASETADSGIVTVKHVFYGTIGDTVAILRGRISSPIYAAAQQAESLRIKYVAAFSCFITLLLILALRHWVSLPLKCVMQGLTGDSGSAWDRLKKSGAEFQQIAVLAATFFEQRDQLRMEVAERKRTESELRDKEGLLRSTLESTADGILVVDANGRASHWNSRFQEIWKIPSYIMDSRDDDLLLSTVLSQLNEPEVFLAKVKELYGTCEESFDTLSFIDGRTLERFSSPLVREGVIIGRVWNFRDITERRKNEATQRRLLESLEKAQRMQSLGLLAGGVAHDLNNTLGPIVGYAELLSREFSPESKVGSKLAKIAQSAEDAAVVIEDLLTLARRGRREMQPTDVNRLIQKYMESPAFIRLQESHPGISVQADLSSQIGLIPGSDVHLSKAIMNLVTNAFEAMYKNGKLIISTEQLYLERLISGQKEMRKGEYVVVRVKDTGEGIPAEDIEKIFEPYFSKKRMGHSGSGLGLSVVYGVVKDHNGYYDIFSKPQEGTEFVLYFPISPEMVAQKEPTRREIQRGAETILVVDDSVDQREMASEIIGSLGYTISTAECGRSAVQFLANNSVDLIVLDMIMEPDFDGLDTYKAILEIYPGQKAIIVSGYSATDRVQETLDLGASCYLKKPYHVEALASALRRALDDSTNTPHSRHQLLNTEN